MTTVDLVLVARITVSDDDLTRMDAQCEAVASLLRTQGWAVKARRTATYPLAETPRITVPREIAKGRA